MFDNDKMHTALGGAQKSMRSLGVSKRLVLAVVASLVTIWILVQSHRLYPFPSYKAIYGSRLLDDINNSTLGVSAAKSSCEMLLTSIACTYSLKRSSSWVFPSAPIDEMA